MNTEPTAQEVAEYMDDYRTSLPFGTDERMFAGFAVTKVETALDFMERKSSG